MIRDSKFFIENPYGRWIRDNLFSSSSSAFLTFFAGFMVIYSYRGIVGFILNPERMWTSVTYNMKLYMILAYPDEAMIRVWLSVGLALILGGLSIGFYNSGKTISLGGIFQKLFTISAVIALLIALAPTNTNVIQNDGSIEVVEIIPQDVRMLILGPSLVLTLTFFFLRNIKIKNLFNTAKVNLTYFGLIIASLYFIKIPTISLDSSGERIIPDPFLPIASTTYIPWTILYVGMLLFFFIGSLLKNRDIKIMARLIPISWFLCPLFIFSWIFKKPLVELNTVFSADIPSILVFGIIGFLIIRFSDNESVGVYRTPINIGFLVLSIVVFLLPLVFIFKATMVLLLLLLVVSPAIATTKEGKRQLFIVWVVSLFVLTFLIRGASSDTMLVTPTGSIFGGFSLTWLLAIFGTYASFPLGLALALGRTSTLPVIRIICTGIIEIVRSVPYITWLFFASVMLTVFLPAGVEFNLIIRVLILTAFFSGAYFAEYIRGGLQSIPKGQYEAANAIGMNPFQRIFLVIVPQALRTIIPTLVGSVITSFKDSSLVAIIGLFDILRIGTSVIPAQSQPVVFIGRNLEQLVFLSFFFWVFTFVFSRRSMKFEKRLGLGER